MDYTTLLLAFMMVVAGVTAIDMLTFMAKSGARTTASNTSMILLGFVCWVALVYWQLNGQVFFK